MWTWTYAWKHVSKRNSESSDSKLKQPVTELGVNNWGLLSLLRFERTPATMESKDQPTNHHTAWCQVKGTSKLCPEQLGVLEVCSACPSLFRSTYILYCLSTLRSLMLIRYHLGTRQWRYHDQPTANSCLGHINLQQADLPNATITHHKTSQQLTSIHLLQSCVKLNMYILVFGWPDSPHLPKPQSASMSKTVRHQLPPTKGHLHVHTILMRKHNA